MTDHAQLSPSARHRWGACPGSVRMEAPLPEPPTNDSALDGTRSHALLERALTFPGFIIENSAGQTMTYESDESTDSFVIDAARIERVKFALGYIKERAAELDVTPIPERRVHPDGLTGRADLHGTVDVQLRGKKRLVIIDYKDGMSPVESMNNPQLEQYAIGALAGISPEGWPVEVEMVIIQPKMRFKGMSGISSWVTTARDLMERVLPTLLQQAAATDDPNAPLIPGDAQCKYCKAKATCPALASRALQGVGMLFQQNAAQAALGNPQGTVTVESGTLDIAHQAAQKDPTKMGAEELRQIMDAAPLLEQFIKSVKAEVKARLDRGEPVPGYKQVQGNGSRSWKLPDAEMEKKLMSALKIPKAALYKTKLPSPAAVKDLTWEKDGTVHSVSAEQWKKFENEWVAYTPGGPAVAPEGDSRPALVRDYSAMFQGGSIPVEATTVQQDTHLPSFFNVTPPSFFNVTPK